MADAEIQHVVVLMLENRSFDCMLGRLYPGTAAFRGVPEGAFNSFDGKRYPAWSSVDMLSPDNACIPTPDPHEAFVHMTQQIYGAGSSGSGTPTMGGFVSDFATTTTHSPGDIMHGFTPEQLPVLSTLAKSFAVCDDWHASAPNQTWPNRFFVHTGTANGYVNNSPAHFPYTMDTVFNLLSENNCTWGVYFHDMPQVATLAKIWTDLPTHLHGFDDFLADAKKGELPNYSFIEPRYFADPITRDMPSDQHPPHDVRYGERLIARCYDAIRSGPGWLHTLFLIIYDEHGGTYDHVPPPTAVSPDDQHGDGFTFDRYGVRVPAVLISPWIAPGTILRRPDSSSYPYDHTSVIATLRTNFGLTGGDLGAREAVAPHVLGVLTLSEPSNGGPDHIPPPLIVPAEVELSNALQLPPNDHQTALAAMALNLPTDASQAGAHVNALSTGATAQKAMPKGSASDVLSAASEALHRFLRGSES